MSALPNINYFDLLLLATVLAGGAWGYWHGATKTVFKLGFIIAPSLALAYFGNDIATIGNAVARMLGDRSSIPLGVIGATGGVMGIIGLAGAFYIGSQFFMAMLDLHEASKGEKAVGAGLGALGLLGIGTAVFIFALKTFPYFMNDFLYKSYAWPYTRPAVVYVYPTFSHFIDRRMAGLMNGLSGNDLIARVALGSKTTFSGSTLTKMLDKVKDVDLSEVIKLREAANKLDPDEVQKLVSAYKSGELSEERLRDQLNNPDIQKLSGEGKTNDAPSIPETTPAR